MNNIRSVRILLPLLASLLLLSGCAEDAAVALDGGAAAARLTGNVFVGIVAFVILFAIASMGFGE